MKADQYGTWAEQKRARMSWVTSSERKRLAALGTLSASRMNGEKCGNCTHLVSDHGDRCSKGDFVTRTVCYCNEFEARK